jgi:dihydrofolate reductase
VAKLVYSAIASLDGFVEDEDGKFDWAAPDPEVHAFVNELERPVGTYLYGRRMYETMRAWETISDPAPHMRDFAEIWRAADKVVYSRGLDAVSTARTRREHDFDPEAVRALKATADRDISVGGPELAGQAIAAGLVDEIHLFLNPILVGGGKPALPTGVRLQLELLDQRRFGSGVVHLHYRTAYDG